jgi:hypothetical protein
MKAFIALLAFVAVCHAEEESVEKRQVMLGHGLGYGGLGYGGLGYGGLGYGGLGYPGLGLGYGAGLGYPAVIGRKRREAEEPEASSNDKRHVLLGGYGVHPGLGYGGLGYGHGLGLGYGLGAVNTGFGYPVIYGRKRRAAEESEASNIDKRQVLLGHGLGYGGLGYGGLGYGYGNGLGLGYGGLGLGAVNTGFGYPAIYGRKRREAEEPETVNKDKKHVLLGGYGVHPGLGYGLGYGGLGYGGLGVAPIGVAPVGVVGGGLPLVGGYPGGIIL